MFTFFFPEISIFSFVLQLGHMITMGIGMVLRWLEKDFKVDQIEALEALWFVSLVFAFADSLRLAFVTASLVKKHKLKRS